MPYRIDISTPPHDVFDLLMHLGALDIEPVHTSVAAILPDSVDVDAVAGVLGPAGLKLSPAVGRDDDSVWLLSPRPVRIGSTVMRLTDSSAFGTGHHPTTALCIEEIEEALTIAVPERILDVGTGSGVLALAALMMGVPRATGLDIDADALKVAAAHARLNNLTERLDLVFGGPEADNGLWSLVVANVLAAPLIEMAPILVRRVASHGRLILSGIPSAAESEVRESYQRLGMRHIRSETRAGWTVVVVQASW